jgi:sarcosine oxidase subunit beta
MGASRPLWRSKDPKRSYDVIIIGGGLHGMACAYFLARDHNIRDVAILERHRLGYGGSGRNTEVFRANQRAPEIIPLYIKAIELWEGLSVEIDYNLMMCHKGVVGTAHSEATLNTMRLRKEILAGFGIDYHILTPEELREIVPRLDISDKPDMPIIGGSYTPVGGTIRHDAAVWGFAKGCSRYGVDLCEGVEVTGIKTKNGKIAGVETNKGSILAPVVHNAAGGWSAAVARLAGLQLAVITFPMQAMVTEPIEPFLDQCLASETYFCFGSQTLKGDLVIGSHMDPWQTYRLYNTCEFASHLSYGWTQLFPDLVNVKVMRMWSGLCDMTPDYAPVMGDTEIKGFYIDAGWGFFGFKSVPACGKYMAEYIATGKRPEIIRHLGIERFYEGALISENTSPRSL